MKPHCTWAGHRLQWVLPIQAAFCPRATFCCLWKLDFRSRHSYCGGVLAVPASPHLQHRAASLKFLQPLPGFCACTVVSRVWVNCDVFSFSSKNELCTIDLGFDVHSLPLRRTSREWEITAPQRPPTSSRLSWTPCHGEGDPLTVCFGLQVHFPLLSEVMLCVACYYRYHLLSHSLCSFLWGNNLSWDT